MTNTDTKVKSILNDPKRSAFQRYRELCYGSVSTGRVIWTELLLLLIGSLPGALGLFLRSKLYPGLFRSVGHKVLFGRGMTLRHPHKIAIGDGTLFDDGVVLDAKGTGNSGIRIGDGVYIGRNSIVYCKNGEIDLGDRVNLSANCTLFSSNRLTMRPGTMVGAYSYLLSGGEYDVADSTPFAEQSGMNSKGPLEIGANCWLAARVTVLDGASIGEHCVVGAGAVVNQPLPPHTLAVGVPARPIRELPVDRMRPEGTP